jgi:hypothetical protein
MKTQELLDRYELLYPKNTYISDLRRAYIDKDISSIFRLLPDTVNGTKDDLRKAVLENNLHSIFRLCENDNLRKLLLEDNVWKLWPLLEKYVDTHFTSAFKRFFAENIKINNHCFSRGQLQSKLWLIEELENTGVDLGTVFICAGWYATLATMIFESNMNVEKIRSFDIDSSCAGVAEIFNKPWVKDDWQFKACTQDIMEIEWQGHNYPVKRNDGSICMLYDSPDTIINTSCEHIKDFDTWFRKIPEGKLICLQSNNYVALEEHVNCVKDSLHFEEMTPFSKVLFTGELPLEKYTRYMRIGIK